MMHNIPATPVIKPMIIQNELEQKLQQAFKPMLLELVNESYMHSVPDGSESHFKAVIVSSAFEGQRLVQQHQSVYKALGESMAKIHALALHTYTETEWQAKQQSASKGAPNSPDCLGGSKADS